MTEKARNRYEEMLHEARPTIQSLVDAEEFLYTVLPNSPKALFKEGEGFNRSRYFMREIGDPQEHFKSIHVAGTSGKGSCAYYLSGVLIAHGFSVGTHTSPHLFDLRERSMINLSYPSEEDFLSSINSFLPVIKDMDNKDVGRPTYFEVTVGNAFSIFARENVDYAVIETGLGGTYDSTNTISRSDKLAVITKIGLDHTDVLGDTVELIAGQKAGIMPFEGDVLALDSKKTVLDVFRAKAKERSDKLEVVTASNFAKNISLNTDGISFDYDDGELKILGCHIPTFGFYQIENVCLAIYSINFLAKRDGFLLDKDAVRKGIASTVIPGRCEVKQVKGRAVIFDGAHNPQKMQAFVDSINQLNFSEKPIWIIGLKKDKDSSEIIKIIKPVASKIIFTEFFKDIPNPRLQDYAMKADELSAATEDSIAISDSKKALKMGLQLTPDGTPLIVSGSIYLIGETSQALKQL